MRSYFLAMLVMLFAASSLMASQLGWDDLINPTAQSYEDPYRDLTYDQIDAVAKIARLNAQIESGTLSDEVRDQAAARVEELKAKLAEQGIDAMWLIAQRWEVAKRREYAATSGNPEVDGKEVTLGGFAIPAPPDVDGTPTAYLVPERGMCSHMPPPTEPDDPHAHGGRLGATHGARAGQSLGPTSDKPLPTRGRGR